ncbi:hypothetical protein GMB86_15225 [Terrilactibacillus sp. BCM23-1]|uniref:Core-binding (CB) domain-containing protein n=1 Tax=Terrilactibacillus tamarindi TaxID=2599694 RepID=A0A6N8CT50_9BACI|nr:SEC-C domain-containing protein [Terrilactibacillus tamarindi]MTT33349.1 hypothetical protein [Terrilactibacillus tamarindi]
MSIKRNDPCPCGSGKKYKKCCMKKDAVIQTETIKWQHFLQQKHRLVEKMKSFIGKNISTTEFYQLESEFNKRSGRRPNIKSRPGFFQFWLCFFHRFDNQLRGIEWFYKEYQHKLANEEKEMAKNWVDLMPRIVQAVDRKGDDIWFKDVMTNEIFISPLIEENLPSFYPWCGTIGLLEPRDDKYYFNGVQVFEGPQKIHRITEKVIKLMKDSGSHVERILSDYFPELLADLFGNVESKESKTIHHYTLKYEIKNEQALIDFLHNQQEVEFDKWESKDKSVSWVKDWKVYRDSEINGEVKFAEVEGTLSIDHHHLHIFCMSEETKNKLKKKMEEISHAVSYLQENVSSKTVPLHVDIRNMLITMGKEVPRYAAIYAQNSLNFEDDTRLPILGNNTINELMTMNRKEEVDIWLKQLECHLYQTVLDQFGEVKVTADFNTIRNQLGLPLSPFVTGLDKRTSSLQLLHQQDTNTVQLKNEDAAVFMKLGFTPDTFNNFYATDMVTFFKERTSGKSASTIRKYQTSLSDLRYCLDSQSFQHWEQCDDHFWGKLMTEDIFNLYKNVSKTRLKDFISTMKTLTKWLDKKYKTDMALYVMDAINKKDEKILEHV